MAEIAFNIHDNTHTDTVRQFKIMTKVTINIDNITIKRRKYLIVAHDFDGDFVTLRGNNFCAGEAFLLVRDPASFLAIIWELLFQQGLAINSEVLKVLIFSEIHDGFLL
jgi:hypothetical protein